jgi:IS4 transposase
MPSINSFKTSSMPAVVSSAGSRQRRLGDARRTSRVERRQAAGVRRDVVVVLGGRDSWAALKQPLRVVEVDTGKINSSSQPETLLLVTNRLDLDAELVALAYRYRWAIELFFRWFKCILGCKHLLSTDRDGLTIQVYAGLIASLLISLWTGKKPTKHTWEMVQFFFSGWATVEELTHHIESLRAA